MKSSTFKIFFIVRIHKDFSRFLIEPQLSDKYLKTGGYRGNRENLIVNFFYLSYVFLCRFTKRIFLSKKILCALSVLFSMFEKKV